MFTTLDKLHNYLGWGSLFNAYTEEVKQMRKKFLLTVEGGAGISNFTTQLYDKRSEQVTLYLLPFKNS